MKGIGQNFDDFLKEQNIYDAQPTVQNARGSIRAAWFF